MDQDLVAYLDRISQQINGFRDEVLEEIRGIHSDLQLLGRGIIHTEEKVVQHEATLELRLHEVKTMISPFYSDFLKMLGEKEDLKYQDVMEVFRERLLKRQA
jgi:hypothetical protein